MSRSLTESARRRTPPATSTWTAAGWRRSSSTIASPSSVARCSSSSRGAAFSATPDANAASTDSSNLGPKPLTPRSFCSAAAVRSASSESIPSSSKSLRARLGPRPGSRVRSISPGGNLARSFSAAGIVPVSSSALSFSSSVLPIPGSVVTRPSRVSALTDVDASRTALAALR